jgi:GPH family glycoside/pentoside/hexuronide:cation symporter
VSRSVSHAEHLSAGRLLAYAAPTVALQAMLVPMYNFLPPTYYEERVGLAAAVVGLMFGLARIWEALSDPIIGAWSDRTNHKWGRRRIWMLAGAPIALVASWFLVNPPAGASAFYLLSLLMIFYLGWTMVYVPHQTWGSELAQGYDERTRIAGFRETGAFVGYLLATVAPLIYWSFYRGVQQPSFGQIVQSVGVFFLFALPIGIVWCFARVPPVVHAVGEETPGWRELFAIVGRNKPFARLLGSYVVDRFAMGIYFAVQPALIVQVYGLGASLLWFALSITIASAGFAPVWVPIARRVGKHRAYCYANIVTALSYVLLFFIPDGNLVMLLAVAALMGLGNGGTMVLPPAMVADAIDNDRLISGVEQAGGHMAFLAFVFKFGMGIGALVGLGALGFWGYNNLGQVLDSGLEQGVRATGAWLPALLLLVPVLAMWRYPLDSRRHAEIRAALAIRDNA